MDILVNGASGKMGSLACSAIEASKHLNLIKALDSNGSLAKTLNELKPDVALDLTTAEVVFENTKTIIESGTSPVIGTSGLTEENIHALNLLAKEHQVGGIIVPNFSVAATIMMQITKQIHSHFSQVEIIETHHEKKADFPSGTARQTAQMLNQQNLCVDNNRGTLINGIPIHSIRTPGVIAKQEVILGRTGETLSITHQSIDRDSFMPGVLLACEKAKSFDGLVIGLEHCLDELMPVRQ